MWPQNLGGAKLHSVWLRDASRISGVVQSQAWLDETMDADTCPGSKSGFVKDLS